MKSSLKILTISFTALLASYSAMAQNVLVSELPLEIGREASVTSRNDINEFCSFPGSAYVYRFIVKGAQRYNTLNSIKHVEISMKGSRDNAVSRYDFIGVNVTLAPGDSGTKYRVFERVQGPSSMPKYFYHATHDRYLRTNHFFANRINVSNGIPFEKIDEADFYADVDNYFVDSFHCGYTR